MLMIVFLQAKVLVVMTGLTVSTLGVQCILNLIEMAPRSATVRQSCLSFNASASLFCLYFKVSIRSTGEVKIRSGSYNRVETSQPSSLEQKTLEN